LSRLEKLEIIPVYETPISLFALEDNPINSGRLWLNNLVNNVVLIRNMREFMARNNVNGYLGKVMVVFKYFFIYDMIPFQKEIIHRLIPLNPRIVEFVLVLLQIR
jgi:hypothetical protein